MFFDPSQQLLPRNPDGLAVLPGDAAQANGRQFAAVDHGVDMRIAMVQNFGYVADFQQ